MDYLATFKDTQTVLQAEQVFIRRRIPFEIVPASQFKRSGCGLALLFSQEYIEASRAALEEAQLAGEYHLIDTHRPHENQNNR